MHCVFVIPTSQTHTRVGIAACCKRELCTRFREVEGFWHLRKEFTLKKLWELQIYFNCICVVLQSPGEAGTAEERVLSRTHQIIQRSSESSLSITADRLMVTDGDHETITTQRQTVRRFVLVWKTMWKLFCFNWESLYGEDLDLEECCQRQFFFTPFPEFSLFDFSIKEPRFLISRSVLGSFAMETQGWSVEGTQSKLIGNKILTSVIYNCSYCFQLRKQ